MIKKNNEYKYDKYYCKYKNIGSHEVSLERYLINSLHGKRPIHTSGACIKNNKKIIKNLFFVHPEVKRGGDLYAWIFLITKFKKMYWSNHIGFIYHVDSENMVTKSAKTTGYLMNNENLSKLQRGLNIKEKKLLKRYFNRWLRNDWKSNVHRGCENFSLRKKLFWRGDFFYSAITYVTTVWPKYILKTLGFNTSK